MYFAFVSEYLADSLTVYFFAFPFVRGNHLVFFLQSFYVQVIFTFSKLLCWVAVDRAIKISELIQGGKSAKKWESLRTEIYNDIIDNAWSDEKQAFTQSYGTSHLDASVLLMEPYGFIDAKDIRYIKTVKAIEKELSHEGLLFRYKNVDDFGTPSSSFTVCTFQRV